MKLLWIALLASLAVSMAPRVARAEALAVEMAEMREALSKNDLSKALSASKMIAPNDSRWLTKLEELTRFELEHDHALEAWRIVQVARRTSRVSLPKVWLDYERLAIYREHSCPLALPSGLASHGHLLNAAVFRLEASLFEADSKSEDVERGGANLAAGLVPYLSDIPRTQLLEGQGCRIQKLAMKVTGLESAELKELLLFLNEPGNRDEARLLVQLRALDLALRGKAADPKVREELESQLPPAEEVPWAHLPDPERQWIFEKLFHAKSLTEVAPAQKASAQKISLANFEQDSSLAAIWWLAGIDLDTLPLENKISLLENAEKRGSFAGRSWVILELARSLAQKGDASGALTQLRRLLVEREEVLSDNQQEAAIDLAASLFAEYRFDQKLLGALQAAVPVRLWSFFVKQAQMRAAVRGRTGDFDRLAVSKESPASLRAQLLRALAHRQLAEFQKRVAPWQSERGMLPEPVASFIGDYSSLLVEGDVQGLAPYSKALAEVLRHQLELLRRQNATSDRGLRFTDLLAQLDPSAPSQTGSTSVSRGVVKVGVAKWLASNLRPTSFALHPPESLPLRELIYVPDAASATEWTLSTARR